VAPYSWSLASGSLPAGMSLNAGTGTLAGTPTASGSFNFTAQVNDSMGQSDPQALALSVAAPSSTANLLFANNFESCSISGWADWVPGNPYISDVRSGGKAHGGNCSAEAQGPGTTGGGYSKLISSLPATNDIWGRMWIYLADSWKLGTYGAPHFWRFWTCIDGSSAGCDEMLIDQSNYADDTLYISYMPGQPHPGAAAYYFVNTGYQVDAGIGKWSCWEVHFRVNSPGQTNGLAEFYVDGTLLKSVTGMNQYGTDSFPGFRYVDWAGNVGGTPGAWPNASNYRFMDDLALATSRIGCN
jgi:hypothetical protein